jgi:perosamine synthetase
LIPLSRPYLGEREEELVLEVLRSGRLSLGPVIERFEELFAARVGAPYAAAVSSGTAALHLLCHMAGLGPGDEVITSPVSFVATANCFLFEGAVPVFADVDPRTLNVDPRAVEAAITERTRAIVAVDMFGYPCELDELRALAARHGLTVIADSCEALGAEYRGAPVGSHGVSAAFAFYANKQITTGEGGMLVPSDPQMAATGRSERNQGRAPHTSEVEHERLGFNYRMSELSAALGLAQLERIDQLLATRARVASLYGERLGKLGGSPAGEGDPDGLVLPCPDRGKERRSWFVYPVRLPAGADRGAVIRSLAEAGIQSKAYLPCVHLMPYYRERFGFRPGQFPVAEAVSERSLALPFFGEMGEAQVEQVARELASALRFD